MADKWVLLLHGFASSGNSSKAQYFRGKLKALSDVAFHAFDFNPTPTDFEYMTITGMINRLRQYLLVRPTGDLTIVGSSLGALVGLNYVHRFGGVKRMLLLAPALSYRGTENADRVYHYAFQREVRLRDGFDVDGTLYQKPVAPPAPTIIIHGRHDDTIPIAYSRRYAALYPAEVRLIEVESDHRLADQLDFIWIHLQSLLGT